MNYRQKEKLVKDLVKKYAEKIFVSHWQITVTLSKDYDDDGAAAKCNSDHRYMWANITVYQCAFNAPNDIDLIIRHELCHCLTDPLYKYCYDLLNGRLRSPLDIEDQREKLTEWISKLI